ncbi:MAG TPA: hypothetical protein VG013_19655 [Gemmataceae bacterium]|jgi:hypothetical protein|nr:hypothetical protein [Gemmataceae bacterium]
MPLPRRWSLRQAKAGIVSKYQDRAVASMLDGPKAATQAALRAAEADLGGKQLSADTLRSAFQQSLTAAISCLEKIRDADATARPS